MPDNKDSTRGGRRNRRHNRNRPRNQPQSGGSSPGSPGPGPGSPGPGTFSNRTSKISPLMSVKVDLQMNRTHTPNVTPQRQQTVGGNTNRNWTLPSPCNQQLGCHTPSGRHYYCERSLPMVGTVTAEQQANLPQPPPAYGNQQAPQLVSFCCDQSAMSDGNMCAAPPPTPTAANLQYTPPLQICSAVRGMQYNPVRCNVLPPTPQGPRVMIRTFYYYVGVKVYPPVFPEGYTNGPMPEPMVVWVPFPIFMYDDLPFVTYGEPDAEHVVKANPMEGNGPTLAAQQLPPPSTGNRCDGGNGKGDTEKDVTGSALMNACPGGCGGCSSTLRSSSTNRDSSM